MKRQVLGFVGLSILAALGCGSNDTSVGSQAPPGATEQLMSTEGRITAPATTDVSTLTSDNAAFGLDLLHALAPQDNFIDSPHSISVALAMTYAGARTTTHDEVARVMHFTLPEPALHAAFDATDLALNGRSTSVTDAGAAPFQLDVVESVWGQKGYGFLPSYLDVLSRYYGAGLWTVDFASGDKASQAINQWVSAQTHAKIPDLLQPGDVDGAKLVLVNAIYFHASWSDAFDTASTVDAAFQRLDGTSVTVPMMHRGGEASRPTAYAATTDVQALELGYAGDAVSMVVLLPTAGQYATFVAGLDGARLTAILGQLAPSPEGVQITLPRFSIRTRLKLKDALSAMGMPTAFGGGGGADFSGIDGTGGLYISNVIHQAMISVDEAGTEAAAATAVPLRKLAITQPVFFTADRPFVYLIRDKVTGAVLFLGQVVDPSVKT
jgi:serpin B